jgi:HAD superfamily hydrolase (TIGR01509 family)
MSGVKALLVDLDGTLVDTADANFAAYREALQSVGVELEWTWWSNHAFGKNWRQFLPELLRSVPGVPAEEVAKRKAALYPKYVDRTVVNEALVRLIRLLRPNVRTALVTAASSSAVELLLSTHGLEELFDEIVTGDDVSEHKPSPLAFVSAAQRLGVSSKQCLVIEDSSVGAAAAAEFGAPCLLVGDFAKSLRVELAAAS